MNTTITESSYPITFTISLLNGKWKLKILVTLQQGTKRFTELEKAITGITPRMLIRELKDLEEKKIIKRKVYAEIPSRVEYSLTENALSLHRLIKDIESWGKNHIEQIKEE